MNKTIKLLCILVLGYILFWHLTFILIFLFRGEAIDLELYKYYFQFLYKSGFVIPTIIQILAILFSLISVSFYTIKTKKY